MGIKKEKKDGVVYKTVNRYSTDRHIYLMSDVPHLIKTTRNCWYASRTGGTRCMWVSNFHCPEIIIPELWVIIILLDQWKAYPLGTSWLLVRAHPDTEWTVYWQST